MNRDESVRISLEDWVEGNQGVATLVFVDIVRSTLLLYGIASVAYMQVIQAYRRRARELVESLHGRLIDMTGDAVFAAFPTAKDALCFARSISENSGDARTRVRVAMHHGVVHANGDALFGRAVHFAARLQKLASDAGIWVSDAAKRQLESEAPELAREVRWSRRAECQLEGIPGNHTFWLPS